MSKKTYAHQAAMQKNKVQLADLPAKTQKLIAAFEKEADEETKDGLDETIFNQVEDFIEARDKDAGADDKTNKKTGKKDNFDVSDAATAQKTAAELKKRALAAGLKEDATLAEIEKAEQSKKAPASRGLMKTILGQK